jgi:hypothetical protein
VIPSGVVADAITQAHQKWLDTPGKKGHAHKDGPMRRLMPDYTKTFGTGNPLPAGWLDPYRDAWHVLQLDPTDPERPISSE